MFVWHDIMYDGPRNPGWPDEDILNARADFLQEAAAGGLDKKRVLETLGDQYQRLAEASTREHIVLWFDACLFDQSMLVHILTCLCLKDIGNVGLLCVDAFPGIEPFNGLGQLTPEQLASLYGKRIPVTEEQFRFAKVVDKAFATQEVALFAANAHLGTSKSQHCRTSPIQQLVFTHVANRWDGDGEKKLMALLKEMPFPCALAHDGDTFGCSTQNGAL